MKSLEIRIIIIAFIAIIIVSSFYFINFSIFPISSNSLDWGAFGDYLGGVLNPILSFLLIILIVKEAVENRSITLDNKILQIKSQEKIDEQIQLLKPKSELVYYLTSIDGMAYAIIENIGNAVAYDITVKFNFNQKLEEILEERFERLSKINYVPPRYKNGVMVAHINIQQRVIELPPHQVYISFTRKENDNESVEKREYFIDENMLNTIISRNEISSALIDVAQEIRNLNKS